MSDVIVRRRRNDSGFVSDWLVMKKKDIIGDRVKSYWTVDISYGVVAEPWFDGHLGILEDEYEMIEDFDTLSKAMDEAMRQTKREMTE